MNENFDIPGGVYIFNLYGDCFATAERAMRRLMTLIGIKDIPEDLFPIKQARGSQYQAYIVDGPSNWVHFPDYMTVGQDFDRNIPDSQFPDIIKDIADDVNDLMNVKPDNNRHYIIIKRTGDGMNRDLRNIEERLMGMVPATRFSVSPDGINSPDEKWKDLARELEGDFAAPQDLVIRDDTYTLVDEKSHMEISVGDKVGPGKLITLIDNNGDEMHLRSVLGIAFILNSDDGKYRMVVRQKPFDVDYLEPSVVRVKLDSKLRIQTGFDDSFGSAETVLIPSRQVVIDGTPIMYFHYYRRVVSK